jgi:hypothetical protein
MTPGTEHRGPDFDHDAHHYEIVYAIKRPDYEFVFSIPSAHTANVSTAPARFQLCFRGAPPEREVVLNLNTLEDFYDSLGHLLDYVNIERQKSHQAQEPTKLASDRI